MAYIHIDPIKLTIDHLVTDNTLNDVDVGNHRRIYLETLKTWDKSAESLGITIAKQRFGSGKSALDQTVEFAIEFICWANRNNNEDDLWGLWGKIDSLFHDKHDYEVGKYSNLTLLAGDDKIGDPIPNTEPVVNYAEGNNKIPTNYPLKVLHSYRFQEPSFELRFGSTAGSATARLSSAQKLRLSSLSSIYNFVGWEYQVQT